MFYSRQLLARKAPLGQIWMAATMKGKINRRELVKLNIIKICEEIMNPSVPMALRLSGILMGGVVIVYERKVKLLYDDVSRLLVELNQAWKVKAMPDPTVLPKGKSQAKYKSITLPENRDEDLGEPEQSLHYTDEATTMMGFTQTAYIAMRLDNVDDPYVDQNRQEDYHQANAADITMVDLPDPTVEDTSMYNRFERFDIDGDEETHLDFVTQEHITNPSTLIPSPPPQERQHPEYQENIHAASDMEVHQRNQSSQGVNRRRARRPAASAMDNEQTIIPGHIYQSWLQDTSDITSRRRNRNKRQLDAMTKRKIAHLMELPPTVLVEGLYTYGLKEVHFPSPLLELWRKTNQPPHDSHSGTTSTCQHPEPSLTSPPQGMHGHDLIQNPLLDFHTGVGSVHEGVSIEKQRANVNNNNLQSEALLEELRTSTTNIKMRLSEANGVSFSQTNPMATPGNSDDEVRSIPSSGSGHGFLSHNSDNSTRSNKKRPISPSRYISYGLEPVDEENSWQHPDPNLKLARLDENGLEPKNAVNQQQILSLNELMVETGPTQTQKRPLMSQSADPITHSIRMQLKAHFETPGTPKVESLNQLASGLERKKAASLFCQICVLATEDSIRVHQKVPYGDILISRGSKI